MLPEQLWDEDDLPDGKMKRGRPSGAAMPLCWAHAEYLSLARSRVDGTPFDRPAPVYRRYVEKKVTSRVEMWTFAHQLPAIPAGKTLRIITAAPAQIRWSADGWATAHDQATQGSGFGCWSADLATDALREQADIEFTFRWQEKWEGRNFAVKLTAGSPAR